MLEELERRNYAAGTIRHYLRCVEQFAQHFGKSPEKVGLEHLRSYQAYLLQQRKLDPASVENHISALRFFFVQHPEPPRVPPVSTLSQGAQEVAQDPEPGRNQRFDRGQQ
jgi:hypothetical protein